MVATRNDSGASAVGDNEIVITVTVTNPNGDPSSGYTPPAVPVASIP